jgi:hypothetical protein
MFRATFRFSLDKDTQSKIRNQMADRLKQAGFSNVKTGTWEAFSVHTRSLVDALSQATEIAERSGKLDHYWTHVEKISLRQRTSLLKAAKELSQQ